MKLEVVVEDELVGTVMNDLTSQVHVPTTRVGCHCTHTL